jgi:hypothetical protein
VGDEDDPHALDLIQELGDGGNVSRLHSAGRREKQELRTVFVGNKKAAVSAASLRSSVTRR